MTQRQSLRRRYRREADPDVVLGADAEEGVEVQESGADAGTRDVEAADEVCFLAQGGRFGGEDWGVFGGVVGDGVEGEERGFSLVKGWGRRDGWMLRSLIGGRGRREGFDRVDGLVCRVGWVSFWLRSGTARLLEEMCVRREPVLAALFGHACGGAGLVD